MRSCLFQSIRQRPVLSFFLLAFGYTWTCAILAYAVLQNSLFLVWIGLFGPAMAAFTVTGICDGKTGLQQLLARLFLWRVPWFAYLFAICVPVVLVAGTVLLHDGLAEMLNVVMRIIQYLPFLLGMTLIMAVVISGEEIGWRGFALPRLQDRLGPWKASVLIGFLWGLWHLPGALDPSHVLNRAPLPLSISLFTLGTIGFSLLYTWLWNYTSGSLLQMCLFHAFYNNLNMLISAVYPYIIDEHWLYLAVLVVIIAALMMAGRRNFRQLPVVNPP